MLIFELKPVKGPNRSQLNTSTLVLYAKFEFKIQTRYRGNLDEINNNMRKERNIEKWSLKFAYYSLQLFK